MSRPPKPPPPNKVVLKLPQHKTPLLVVRARAIVRAMTDNAWFPSPDPPLATVTAAIEALSEAQAATLSRARETFSVRDTKRIALVRLLQQLRNHVQICVDANVDYAASIAASALMDLQRPGIPPSRVFGAKPGRVSGEVVVVAPKAADRAAYEWAYSLDGGRTWIAVPATSKATTTVTGLARATHALFRYRAEVKGVMGDWSDPVAFFVL